MMEPRKIQKLFYTRAELGEMLQVCEQTILALDREGKIPGGIKVGRQFRYSKSLIDKWLEDAVSSADKQSN
mgnify:CR=1 FL=1